MNLIWIGIYTEKLGFFSQVLGFSTGAVLSHVLLGSCITVCVKTEPYSSY